MTTPETSSRSWSFEDIKAEADRRFGPIEIFLTSGQSVKLRTLLRLSETEQGTVLSAMDTVNAKEESVDTIRDTQAALDTIFTTIADRPDLGAALVQACNGDLGIKMTLLQRWAEATQPGEAPSSPDSTTDSDAS